MHDTTGYLNRNRISIAILFLTVIGAAIRLYHLDWQCLTVDERVTLSVAAWGNAPEVLKWSLTSDYNPPLYYMLAHFSSGIFGSATIFSIRLPAAIFGIGLIPAIYYVGKELYDNWLGLFAAGVITFLYPFIYYSQNARAYTLVIFAFLWFIFFFMKIYRGDIHWFTIVSFALCTVACIWSHLYSTIPIVIAIILILWKYRNSRYSIAIAMATAVLMCIPVATYFWIAVRHFELHEAIPRNIYWITHWDLATMVPYEFFAYAWVPIVVLIGYSILRAGDPLVKEFSMIGAITILSAFPLLCFTIILPRYLLLVSPPLILVGLYPIARGMKGFGDGEKTIALAFIIAVIIFGSFQQIYFWYTFNLCPYF